MRSPSAFGKLFSSRVLVVAVVLVVVSAVVSAINLFAQRSENTDVLFALDSLTGLEIVNGKAEVVTYRGRHALHLSGLPDHADPNDNEPVMAFLTGVDFKNGSIDADVAGAPLATAPSDARGFIGILFRSQDHGARAENIYLRPTNGRADDQLRRNHSVQYESIPDFPWFQLRKETPGAYESYADLNAGAWTHMKIVVSSMKALLYVNGSDQPCLVVNDLKLGETHGQVALRSLWSTDAYFSRLTIRSDRQTKGETHAASHQNCALAVRGNCQRIRR